jgi:serine/threonine protein kinase
MRTFFRTGIRACRRCHSSLDRNRRSATGPTPDFDSATQHPPRIEATAMETAAGEVLGSPPYMAPEQLLGKPVHVRTDLYAAGACLYELATGKRPYGEKRARC